jgi:predicted ribosome quality control (RQC) complex YloA/Tae2 family protein
MVARDDIENEMLIQQALDEDLILRSMSFPGPAAVLRSKSPTEEEIRFVAGLIQYFSKLRGSAGQPVDCWRKSAAASVSTVTAAVLDEAAVKAVWM